MELRRYLGVLRRRLWLVAILLAVGAIVGDLLTPQLPVYAATATIYIGPSNFTVSPGAAPYAGEQQALLNSLVPTYSKMLASQPIAASALKSIGLRRSTDSVLAHTQVSVETNTSLIQLTETDGNPLIAEELANAMAGAFSSKVKTLQSQPGQGTVPAAPAYIFEKASVPGVPLPPKTTSNVIRGGLAGLVVGIGLAGLLEYLDVTIKGPADAERQLQLPVLGVIPLRRQNA